jgi:hypothetical protein
MLIPVFNSCKKGDEDPAFSFYSRKHRLCQDWTFSFYKRIEQNNDTIISYTFDGASWIKVEANQTYISSATMKISFSKDGSYLWDQTIATADSTYTYNEEGSWYFTGGGKDSDTKYKELLAMQKTKVTSALQAGGVTNTTNYYGTGNLNASVYKIIELSSDEVKLESILETNYIPVSPNPSDLKKITENITLKKSL